MLYVMYKMEVIWDVMYKMEVIVWDVMYKM